MYTLDLDPRHAPACAGTDVDAFFPPVGVNALTAVRICRTCPLVDVCREWAIENMEVGIWGATSDRQRARIRTRRAGGTSKVHHGTQRRTITARQQVAALVDRYTAQQIADRLGVTARTVERHKAALRAEQKEAA